MVTFGEVARQVKTKVNPADTDLDRYVRLEHLDPESLQIRRWGVPEDVTGEKIVVRKGDIIFGKRRAYQRKVAIADFDCICSAHAMVLQPKEDVIIKGIFPFFLQSDRFMNRAVQISVGGLSPTINWKDLARQEFPLPPIDEQRRIAEILWAAEDVIVKNEGFVAEVEHYKQLMLRDLFSKGIGHEEFQKVEKVGLVPVEWEINTLNGISQSIKNGIYKQDEFYGRGYPSARMYNIQNGKINLEGAPLLDVTEQELEDYGLKCGDILINRVNSVDLIGKAGIVPHGLGPITYESKNIRIRLKINKVHPPFIGYFTQTDRYFIQIMMRTKSAIGQATINQNDLERLIVPLPPLPEQRQIAAILSSIDDAIAAARASVEASKALKMRLINQLLSPSAGDDA